MAIWTWTSEGTQAWYIQTSVFLIHTLLFESLLFLHHHESTYPTGGPATGGGKGELLPKVRAFYSQVPQEISPVMAQAASVIAIC